MKPRGGEITASGPATTAPARSFLGAAGGEPAIAAGARNEFQRPNRDRAGSSLHRRRPPGPAPRPVTAETLADALPPRVTQASVDLPTATVGSPYRAELPAFADPGGKGLRLSAERIAGRPELQRSRRRQGSNRRRPARDRPAPRSASWPTNHNDRRAQMSATLVVADKPAPSPGAGRKARTPRLSAPCAPFRRRLPPNLLASQQQPAAPQVPAPGPQADNSVLSAGRGRSSGAAGCSAFRSDAADGGARRTAPAGSASRRDRRAPGDRANATANLAPPIPLPIAPASPEEKAKAFIASFDGGECFLIEPLPGATKPHEYQAVGREIEPFRRFDSAYKREVGVEADLTVAPISAAQCPALDLVRLAAPVGRQPPRLTLKNYEVGPGQAVARDDFQSAKGVVLIWSSSTTTASRTGWRRRSTQAAIPRPSACR